MQKKKKKRTATTTTPQVCLALKSVQVISPLHQHRLDMVSCFVGHQGSPA
jgi:hypothetical protein